MQPCYKCGGDSAIRNPTGYCDHLYQENPSPQTLPISAVHLYEFTTYCQANPELRFWQALRGFAKVHALLAQEHEGSTHTEDTYYWE